MAHRLKLVQAAIAGDALPFKHTNPVLAILTPCISTCKKSPLEHVYSSELATLREASAYKVNQTKSPLSRSIRRPKGLASEKTLALISITIFECALRRDFYRTGDKICALKASWDLRTCRDSAAVAAAGAACAAAGTPGNSRTAPGCAR